jgi:hypothetical protein
MIYILDDRAERKGRQDLFKFGNIKTDKVLDCQSEDELDDYVKREFSDAELVLLHKSYRITGTDIPVEAVCDSLLKNNINVVLFSGGTDRSTTFEPKPPMHVEMNADRMYSHLEIFFKHYSKSGKIDKACLDYLIWGENARKNQLLKFQYNLYRELNEIDFSKRVDEISKVKEIHDIADDALGEDFCEFKARLREICDNKKNQDCKIEQLLSEIQQLVNTSNL